MTLVLIGLGAGTASAQLGALVSPGRLNKAHASLEGITQCLSCHTAGRKVAADKCLSCHQPVAARMAARKGVHRNVTTDCVACHVEHAGVDAELRPFDPARFNHAAETTFALDGLHAPGAATCASCHKTRSFLTASPSCSSCHQDSHKGKLGADCATCHSTRVRFAETRSGFDHARTSFPLSGAHTRVACESCHPKGEYARSSPATCATCHTGPHDARQFPGACSTCHGTASWRTTRVDHARTAFPLRGQHAAVACVACHVKPAASVPVPHETCATCHVDPHRGKFRQDCAACHTESSFTRGTFDHATTGFPLADKHGGLACAACHKNSRVVTPVASRTASRPVRPPLATVDFGGLQAACASCHQDPHAAELGTACQTCHSARTFRVTAFTHANPRAFFAGGHAGARCDQCHVRPPLPANPTDRVRAVPGGVANRAAPDPPPLPATGLTRTPTGCASCHADVHLGQVGARCETCHAIDAPKFAVVGFSHTQTTFSLTGRHAPLACAACHKPETARFPAGAGTATRLSGLGTACATCHVDPHASQLGSTCEQCHRSDTFRVRDYAHQNAGSLKWFFAGAHLRTACATCHKAMPSRSSGPPAPPVIAYRLATTCTNCHEDKHRGALGPRCESCHRLN
jgi:hypothetical protein